MVKTRSRRRDADKKDEQEDEDEDEDEVEKKEKKRPKSKRRKPVSRGENEDEDEGQTRSRKRRTAVPLKAVSETEGRRGQTRRGRGRRGPMNGRQTSSDYFNEKMTVEETTGPSEENTNETQNIGKIEDDDEVQIIESASKYFPGSEPGGSHEPKAGPSGIKQSVKRNKKEADSDDEDGEDSESDDWERVEDAELEPDLEDYHPQLPEEGVEVTLKGPELVEKRKRKKCDYDALIRQEINRNKRQVQRDLHKVHILCLVGRGFFLNTVLSCDQLLKAFAFSHLSSFTFERRSNEINLRLITSFVSWFKSYFVLRDEDVTEICLKTRLLRNLETRETNSRSDFVLIFILLMRCFVGDIEVRLCYSLDPLPLKANDLIVSDKQRKQPKKPEALALEAKASEKAKEEAPKKGRKKINRKIVSSDSEESVKVEKRPKSKSSSSKVSNENAITIWAEIYSTTEEKWICVDPVNNVVDEPQEVEKNLTLPVVYILAFEARGYVKDVTQRYSSNWLNPAMQRLRVDKQWLDETLSFFKSSQKTRREIEEDEQFSVMLSMKPLPTKLGEYKNHPLYALARHLLKSEVIYPPDAPTLGFFRGEPVYARECVQTVHSKVYWMRQARVIRSGETPYKVSTSRRKWDKFASVFRHDIPQELFGFWQTEDFDPPEVKDGIVPRNEYGNVELFQPSMVPKGGVHIRLPALLKTANKLGIDCVPAVVGFDSHTGGGGVHPVFDGFVVCKEYKDVLIAAWDEEQEIAMKKEKEKREKRIYGNWRKLIRGVLIRERINKKYHRESDEDTEIEDI